MAVARRLNSRLLYFAAAGDVVTEDICVKKIVWSGPTTAGHNVDFKDGSGNALFNLWQSVTATGNIQVDFGEKGFWFPGLEVDVLDSGVVLVFLAEDCYGDN